MTPTPIGTEAAAPSFEQFWQQARQEALNRNEGNIYRLLKEVVFKIFKRLKNSLKMLEKQMS